MFRISSKVRTNNLYKKYCQDPSKHHSEKNPHFRKTLHEWLFSTLCFNCKYFVFLQRLTNTSPASLTSVLFIKNERKRFVMLRIFNMIKCLVKYFRTRAMLPVDIIKCHRTFCHRKKRLISVEKNSFFFMGRVTKVLGYNNAVFGLRSWQWII